MTKGERAMLQRAVRLIWENDFEAGMRLLLPLTGMRVPAWDAADKAEVVTLKDIVQRASGEEAKEHLLIVRIRPDGDERVMDTYEYRTEAETDLLRYRNGGPPGWKYEIRERD